MTEGNKFDALGDRLRRAMRPIDSTAPNAGWQFMTSGGGAGGTSSIDDDPFTPGGTEVTPVGGYYGGRQVGSGGVAAVAISGSAILQVEIVAGGAVAPLSSALYDGIVSGITTTGAAMPSVACAEVIISAAATNAADLLIGNSSSQSNPLPAGGRMIIPIDNMNRIYRKALTGTLSLTYLARN